MIDSIIRPLNNKNRFKSFSFFLFISFLWFRIDQSKFILIFGIFKMTFLIEISKDKIKEESSKFRLCLHVEYDLITILIFP